MSKPNKGLKPHSEKYCADCGGWKNRVFSGSTACTCDMSKEYTELRKNMDKLLDNHFRLHQDYIYNPHATSEFLDATVALIETSNKAYAKSVLKKAKSRGKEFVHVGVEVKDLSDKYISEEDINTLIADLSAGEYEEEKMTEQERSLEAQNHNS